MNINDIPVITVSYNSPELIHSLLSSFRKHYSNPYYIIDGSEPGPLAEIKKIAASFENVQLIDFGYNIHHGPGLAWAIQNLPLSGQVLFLDSDITIVNPGAIEALLAELKPGMYGVGCVAGINRDGFDIPDSPEAIRYLHPPCMLCNIEVMKQWPLPIKHGAPMVEAMLALHDAGASGLIANIDWVGNDIRTGTKKVFIDHMSQGTVVSTGGYHLEEWMQQVQQQAGASHGDASATDDHKADLLTVIPKEIARLVEVGCGRGNLAAAYKAGNPNAHFQGIEADAVAVRTARERCDAVFQLDIESAGQDFFTKFADTDCWIFDETLEQFSDPWEVLRRVRAIIPPTGSIVACINNAQHWSLLAKLSVGDFRYQDGGLLDRSHRRWFTRATILELFNNAGFRIVGGHSRIFDEPGYAAALPAIQLMARSFGADPELAANDSRATQYVIHAMPA